MLHVWNIYLHLGDIWGKYTDNIRTGILDYLREGFPWPARPFKHTESNSFKHTVTTFKYTHVYFILPPGPRGLARPPHVYSCRCRFLYSIHGGIATMTAGCKNSPRW